MKVSKKWLNDFYQIKVSDKNFADAMTLSGSKVESLKCEGDEIKNVVVGKIIEISKHEDADRLLVCTVDVGAAETLNIVTGAQNLSLGDFVPLALDGAVLANGTEIEKGEIRGVASAGMLCSLAELGLTLNDFPYAIEDGIFILGEDCVREPGLPIQSAIGLDDLTIEFEITSNRPDCLSIVGLAREAAATFNEKLPMKVRKELNTTNSLTDRLDVEIHDSSLCYRYIGAIVENVKIAPSPRWMRERLRACGVRPINNIVDITNYVMLELGQPMHAFDIRYLKGNKVNVRKAKHDEKIVTLEGEERNLTPDMLVIADAEKPVAIAGVMGGEYSGVMDDTTTVVFESACFNGASVRATAKELGMRTESSARFEKGLDPHGCLNSMSCALELVEKLKIGKVVEPVVDCIAFLPKERQLDFDWKWINDFIGIDLEKDKQAVILENLSFKVKGNTVSVPTFRNDVEHKADLSEEIARFYGYENIDNVALSGIAEGMLSEKQSFEKLINTSLLAMGYSEVQSYSFISDKAYDKMNLANDSHYRNSVRLLNPLSEDIAVMRTTPLPSMLEILAANYNKRNTEAGLFELATVYIPRKNEELPLEKQKITIGAYGEDYDFFKLKGSIEELLEIAGIENIKFEPDADLSHFHSGRCARVKKDELSLGVLGEVHPTVCENFAISARVLCAELDFELIFANKNLRRSYKPLPKYPAIERDLALICDFDTPVGHISDLISDAAGEFLENLELFDVYEGSQIKEGKKSVAFSLRLRSHERTLNDRDADLAMEKIVSHLKNSEIYLRD